MDRGTKRQMEYAVERLQGENPPSYGTGLYEEGHPIVLRRKMAYQRWMLMKVAAAFPQVPMIEAVTEVIAPMCR